MRIWPFPQVPGKALPGERARRRAVEGSEGAEQAYPPMLRRASQWRRESPPNGRPTVTLETTRDGWARQRMPRHLCGRSSSEMEVIRDQFRLYVWAAVGSYRRCDSCGDTRLPGSPVVRKTRGSSPTTSRAH